MNVIETRLIGHQANMNSITRFINREMGGMKIDRVELRYSTQSAEPLAAHLAKSNIANLLRENGMGLAQVSVRPHEGPIDDATGEHVLRLYPAKREMPNQRRTGLFAWLARVFPRWFQSAPTPPNGTVPLAAKVQDQKKPTLTNAAVVTCLRKAVQLAAAYVETDTGTAIVTGSSSAQLVGEAKIIVRLDYLHEVLGPMVQGDVTQAAKSIGDMVRAQSLVVAPAFKVSYLYQPRAEVVGTSYANESDVEVQLRLTPGKTQRVEPTLDESQGSKNTDTVNTNGDLTLMPKLSLRLDDEIGGTAMPARTPALTVRVLGTLHKGGLQPFAQAFELHFATLPARFDRAALAQAGFGRAHPDLLSVASNSSPLDIDRGEDGTVQLQSSMRTAPDGSILIMYRRRDTLAALTGTECWSEMDHQLVVNDPTGVVEKASGRTLPALVIELQSH